MPQNYTPESKKKIVRLHEEEGRTYKSITSGYGVSKASISKWCSGSREGCLKSPETKAEYDNMKELLKLKRKNGELRKENLFLKKAAAFFAKEIDQRLMDSLNSIPKFLACAGCSGGQASAPMLTITTGSTRRQVIMPKKQRSWHGSAKYITTITVWTGTGA